MVTATSEPPRRLWLIFFKKGGWHVSAASYYADVGVWVYVDAVRTGLVVEVWPPERFGDRLAQLLDSSEAVLRMPSAVDRKRPPFSWWCVGAVKALLGVRSRALLPRQLYRHLLNNGAECVVIEGADGQLFQTASSSSAGRS